MRDTFSLWYNYTMTDLEYKLEEMWDFIASEIGFDEKGEELQNAIRKFVELKIKQSKNEKL